MTRDAVYHLKTNYHLINKHWKWNKKEKRDEKKIQWINVVISVIDTGMRVCQWLRREIFLFFLSKCLNATFNCFMIIMCDKFIYTIFIYTKQKIYFPAEYIFEYFRTYCGFLHCIYILWYWTEYHNADEEEK